MIRDHVWRARPTTGPRRLGPYLERPCEYVNCRQPMSEHERAYVRHSPRAVTS